MRVSGPAVTPKPAQNADTSIIPRASPMDTPSSLDGTIPGSSRSLNADRVGEILSKRGVSFLVRIPITWLLNRYARCYCDGSRTQRLLPSCPAMQDMIRSNSVWPLADDPVCLLVRVRSGRCFYATPWDAPTGGRPRRHGAKCVCDDPSTWSEPTDAWNRTEAQEGRVQVQPWSGWRAIPHNPAQRGTRQAKPIVIGTLIR